MLQYVVSLIKRILLLLGLAVVVLLVFSVAHQYLREHALQFWATAWRLFVQKEGTTTPGFISNILWPVISIGVAWYLIRRERGKEVAVKHLREEALLAVRVVVIVALLIYGPMAIWCVMRTIYDDHHNVGERWRATISERNGLKQGIADRDAYIKRLEGKSCPVCPKIPPEKPATVRTPTIKAFPDNLGPDANGLIRTQFTLVCDGVLVPPLTVELDFDAPIYGLSSTPLPKGSAWMGGGDRWSGTHGFATIPNTGMNPNLSWQVVVLSRREVHLVSPPRARAGY